MVDDEKAEAAPRGSARMQKRIRPALFMPAAGRRAGERQGPRQRAPFHATLVAVTKTASHLSFQTARTRSSAAAFSRAAQATSCARAASMF